MKKLIFNLWICAAFIFISGFGSGERFFAPNSELWERWEAHDEQNQKAIDHTLWDDFLKKNLILTDGYPGRINYEKTSTADRLQLNSYLQASYKIKINSYNRAEQFAFWVNLYNAFTVNLILDNYPVKSIKDISPSFFGGGPWKAKLLNVDAQEISLNDIEHRILRPIWQDPRIHYAVNCAALGCPSLQARALSVTNRDDYLNTGARNFINSPQGVTLTEDVVSISKIYDWFIEDFGGTEEAVLIHLSTYAKPKLAAKLKSINKINSVFYDWNLNGNQID